MMSLVHVVEGGERVQMSKRSGDFVTLDELVDDIGVDATRWFMLWRSHETTVDLDLELARSQSSENPVYYVQYAHARIASILRKAGEETATEPAAARRAAGAGGEREGPRQAPARVPGGGAGGGGAPGPAPDLRLLDRGRRRLPRLLPRLPGGRRRGRGGRSLAAGALPGDEADDRRRRWGCWGSRRPSGCDAAGPQQDPRAGGDRRPGRVDAGLGADGPGLRGPPRGAAAAGRAAGRGGGGGGGRAGDRGDRPRLGGRRLRPPARSWSSAISRARGWRRRWGSPRPPACTSTCAGRRSRPTCFSRWPWPGPRPGSRGSSSASAPGARRRKRRRCSACRASAHVVGKLRAAYELVLLIAPPVQAEPRACATVAAKADAAVAGLSKEAADGRAGKDARAAARRLPAPSWAPSPSPADSPVPFRCYARVRNRRMGQRS